MERRMQRDERTKEDWSPLDALRDDLLLAQSHSGKTIAFRAVIKEIEERIGG